ncbi:MAG TPA: HAMP domain-containing sensor histidine kinase [Aggregatilineaceae bacterium]|nr:HAMP domain-containing sensor histidine kinase [Aggregatilineaceae bacterium]
MNKLWVRLAGVFVIITLITVGTVAVVVNRTTTTSFRRYVGQQNMANSSGDLVQSLENLYATTSSWEGAQDLLTSGRGGGRGAGQGRGAGPSSLVAQTDYLVIAATDSEQIGRTLDQNEREVALVLTVNGKTVGYLVRATVGMQALDHAQQNFLDDVSRVLTLTAGIAVLLAVAIGLGFAWLLVRPLRYLRISAAQITRGELGAQMPLVGTSEFREVATAFNAMSAALAESRLLRQRMTSDIAHELRSPVSVMRGQLEAMMDGVFPLNTEQLAVVYDQTLHLGRLIEDLRTLTRAEADRLPLEITQVAPGGLSQQVVSDFASLAQDQGIVLSTDLGDNLPSIKADAGRLRQVLANLVSNALKHTPTGGRVTVTTSQHGSYIRFVVSDTGSGLTPEQVGHIFERFYRTDEARQRDQTGSGLGLAISQELVRLHQGRIWVESQVGQGSQFIVELPAADGQYP